MARPKAPPHVRFSDVFEALEQADTYGQLMFKAHDERHAIHICHRMNLCRKAIAEENTNSRLYRFVIRVVGTEVHVVQREQMDMSRCFRLDGSPFPQSMDETSEEYKRLYAEGRRKAQETIDAMKNKPLDLDTE